MRRGSTYEQKGDAEKTLADFATALRLEPNNANVQNAVAWILATYPDPKYRNGQKAVSHATKACELSSWKEPASIDTLAATYAETGGFSDAVKWENKYLEFPLPAKAAETGRQRLALYQQSKSYHEEIQQN